MKVCVATGTRAEYGLLKPLMDKLVKDQFFELVLLVTGTHLSPEFGLTHNQITEDGFNIDYKVEMLLSSDTPEGITKSMGLGLIGYADAFKFLKPDLLVVLGDRYEVLSLASTALIFNVPIAHLHGGEITEGAYDESIRHAVTKMSHLHFTSTKTHQNRVIQLGESPHYVYNVGAIGLDNIRDLKKMNSIELENSLNVKFNKYNYILAYHPETLSRLSVKEQFRIILDVVENEEDSFFIFTKSNADTDGRVINQMMEDFASKNPNKAAFFSSLGSLRFLSLMEKVNAIIGNSSAGIIEAKSVNTPAINIGDRQKGRVQPKSVVNCSCNFQEISKALLKINEVSLIEEINNMENPYGDGFTSQKIIDILKSVDLSKLNTKPFFDL